MEFLKVCVVGAFVFLSGASYAQVSELFKPEVYDCFIIGILDKEANKEISEEFFEFSFRIDLKPGEKRSHGGLEKVFTTKDKMNTVTVIADNQWLGLAWEQSASMASEKRAEKNIKKNLKKIGEAVTVSTAQGADSRVIIVMNPSNNEERVSLTCDRGNSR